MHRFALGLVIVAACRRTDADAGEGTTSMSAGGPSSDDDASGVGDSTSLTSAGSDAQSSSDGGTDDGPDDGTAPPGGPGCGFASAAFCETFDAIADVRGRAGDLDPARWSAARGNPQLATSNGNAIAAGPATIGSCRADLPAQVFPDADTLVCDASADIASNHLLVAVGAQNYGQNSYRIRQPFDFADRTGTIVFDAEAWMVHSLLGWISVEITEDPAPLPSFSIGAEGQNNDEGGAVPRNAVEIQLQGTCLGEPDTVAVRFIDVITDYTDELFVADPPTCVATAQHKLNHFEVRISQTRVEVWASPFSADGSTFAPPVLLQAADVQLPFSRGWVHLTVHNHATLKYSADDAYGATESIDAWVARWDNVGFDGPVIEDIREVEVADSLIMGTDAHNIAGPVMNVGYRLPDTSVAVPQMFVLSGVELDGIATARLSLAMWYLLGDSGFALPGYTLRQRWNGNAWHERSFTAGELAVLGNGHAQGALGQMLDVPIADLVEGDNVLELETSGVPQSYPPAASAIDLLLFP
jgi:hypothetical protein